MSNERHEKASKHAISPTQSAIVDTIRRDGGKTDATRLVVRARRDDAAMDIANVLFGLERDLRTLHEAGLVEFSRSYQEKGGVHREQPLLSSELDTVFPLNPLVEWNPEGHGFEERLDGGYSLRINFTHEGKTEFAGS